MLETKNSHIGFWHLAAGVIMVLLGVYVWFNPLTSLLALALYLGVAFIIIGGVYIAASFSFESGWYLFVGILDIFVGLILAANLGITAETLPIVFALWCLAVGVVQVVVAYRLRKEGFSWSGAFSAGLIGIIFAFLILAYPMLGTITITTLMGAYILLYGVVEILEYNFIKKLERLD